MSYLNGLGRVRRNGQWRLRLVIRQVDPAYPDGRLDLSDNGLVDFPEGAEVLLTVTRRRDRSTRGSFGTCGEVGGEVPPVLQASRSDGTLFVSSPGWIEAVFPAGWSARIPDGLLDVRVFLTIGPETTLVREDVADLR